MYSNYEVMKQLGQDRIQARLVEARENHLSSAGEKSAGFRTILKTLFHNLAGSRQIGSRPIKRSMFREKAA